MRIAEVVLQAVRGAVVVTAVTACGGDAAGGVIVPVSDPAATLIALPPVLPAPAAPILAAHVEPATPPAQAEVVVLRDEVAARRKRLARLFGTIGVGHTTIANGCGRG
jgi:hypothetical protein